jgi:hypothetical protein
MQRKAHEPEPQPQPAATTEREPALVMGGDGESCVHVSSEGADSAWTTDGTRRARRQVDYYFGPY